MISIQIKSKDATSIQDNKQLALDKGNSILYAGHTIDSQSSYVATQQKSIISNDSFELKIGCVV
jgi:hypothetical protein